MFIYTHNLFYYPHCPKLVFNMQFLKQLSKLKQSLLLISCDIVKKCFAVRIFTDVLQ